MKNRIWVDLDGVMADFDDGHEKLFGVRPIMGKDIPGMWEGIHSHGNWYRELPLMPNAMEMWNFLEPYNRGINTGCSMLAPDSAVQKRDWVAEKLGPEVYVHTGQSKKKYEVCTPGDIIIDDYAKHAMKWIDVGGKWILHWDCLTTLAILQSLESRGLLDHFKL